MLWTKGSCGARMPSAVAIPVPLVSQRDVTNIIKRRLSRFAIRVFLVHHPATTSNSEYSKSLQSLIMLSFSCDEHLSSLLYDCFTCCEITTRVFLKIVYLTALSPQSMH